MSTGFILRCAILGLAVAMAFSIGPAGQASEADADAAAVPSDRAVIHFVDYGGIRNWRAGGDDALYIEAQNRKWYKATFFGPCTGLRFSNSIGFVSDSGGSVDRFGSIVVRGPGHGTMECHFRTFSEIPAPPPSPTKAPPEADKKEKD